MSMNPTTDPFGSDRIRSSGRILREPLVAGPPKKTYLIIFARTTLWSYENSQSQRYIGFRPISRLGSYVSHSESF